MRMSSWFPVAVVVLMLAGTPPGQAQDMPDEATRTRVADWIDRCRAPSDTCRPVIRLIEESKLGPWCLALDENWDTARLLRDSDTVLNFIKECVPIVATALDEAEGDDDGPREAGERWKVAPADRVMQAAKRSNLRSGPGIKHDKVGLLDVGDEVRVTGEVGDWFRIETAGGGEAFVYGELLAEAPTRETTATAGQDKAGKAAATLAANCKDWNTYDFFGAATPAILTRCLRAGADPKARDRNGWTPLHWASSRSGNPVVINVLVEAGADLDAREVHWGETPLHRAVRSDRNPGAVIDALVNAGADLSAEDQSGKIPLDDAAYLGNTPATAALVKAVSQAGLRKIFGISPLHEAALSEEADVVSSLLNAGADPNARYRTGATSLHWAASATGNSAVIAALLKGGSDPNARDQEGRTPLHWAAFSRTPIVLDALLKGGADLNARDENQQTPLHDAARYSNPTFVTLLLKAGADLDTRGNFGGTPLHESVWNQDVSVMRTLLKAGADPNAREYGPGSGDTPLHGAASRKNPIYVKALLKAGANANARGSFGDTPLHDAGSNGNPAIAAILLAAGADPSARNEQGEMPLDKALAYNNRAVADLLLKGGETAQAIGTDPNARDQDGSTSLHRAAESGTSDAIIALFKAGAEPNVRDKDGETPLHRAAHQSRRPAVIAALVTGGADLKAQANDGSTPLHRAASWNETPEVSAALLKAGANPNARDKREKTPLHGAAAEQEDLAVVDMLLRAGAAPNARDGNGWTPLHAAVFNKNPAVTATLIRAGADPNIQDRYGETPLHFSSGRSDKLAVTAALLKAGADPNVPDQDNNTPLHSAVSGQNPAAIAALLKAGADPSIPDYSGNTPLDDARQKNDPAVIAALPQGPRRQAGSAPPAHPASESLSGACGSGPICQETLKNAELVLRKVEDLIAAGNLDITNTSLSGAFTTRASIACIRACLEREESRAMCRSQFEQMIGEFQKTYESAVRSAREASLDDDYVDEFEASPQNSSFGRKYFSHIQGNLDTCGY